MMHTVCASSELLSFQKAPQDQPCWVPQLETQFLMHSPMCHFSIVPTQPAVPKQRAMPLDTTPLSAAQNAFQWQSLPTPTVLPHTRKLHPQASRSHMHSCCIVIMQICSTTTMSPTGINQQGAWFLRGTAHSCALPAATDHRC